MIETSTSRDVGDTAGVRPGYAEAPNGYQWVQVGPDQALVAVATGIIAQLILSH